MIGLVLAYSFIAVILGILLMWARSKYIFAGVYILILVALLSVGGQLLGRPKPVALDIFNSDAVELLHEEYREGVAIYLTVRREGQLTPTLFELSWSMETAKKLREMREGQGNPEEEDGTRIMMRKNNHEGGGEPMIYLDIPDTPPPKLTARPKIRGPH